MAVLVVLQSVAGCGIIGVKAAHNKSESSGQQVSCSLVIQAISTTVIRVFL